ncbi:vacuolar protein sorting-associated protein 28 homolog 2 isoform X2 [Solanum tuberosum]|uniref:vacuolar protein sorting-associated protein 28 homolog 2 isoform X2 n=1 Tax=Solanum tuberosum TaxID=4113 RepID=UPI00073A097F|nr:PREDICTED: vacuolar protein sorting-associated protein 28 homolog 2 isoform X2 [Solanum tuberosum]
MKICRRYICPKIDQVTKTIIFARVPSSSPTFLTEVKILLPTPMEVKLWNDKREREMYENFAELFAIIKATEKLEKAYVRDIISPAEYEAECQKLIAHFKTLSSTLKDTVPSIEQFHDTYKMDCPAALNRLVTSGVPATVEHRAAAATSSASSASVVAECVQNFITAMDSLKLNMIAVDQVHPLLSDLSSSLNKLLILPSDFEGKTKMREWLSRLSKMGAADELTEQQARQLHFDLESSYNSFMAALPSAGT